MLFKISAHLKKLSEKSPGIKRQFYTQNLEILDVVHLPDPLMEEEHTKVKGLIHKYDNRVLILLTLNCAAYCRFCTRKRTVSQVNKGIITDDDLRKMRNYILANPKIKEIIFSGGDPFTVPPLLNKALKLFSNLPQIKIIRIGTRVPVSDPSLVNNELIKAITVVKKQPLYVMVHFEHPDEITPETIRSISMLRKAGAILFSQSVFLKGVNDSFEILYKLFSGLIEFGVKPYYLYRCDPVSGAEHFIVDFKKEVEIASKLRRVLSGLACPMYIIDVPEGSGKIPVPLDFWECSKGEYFDFEGKRTRII
jgi:lysine 2,3-aminomutase